jgi:hypothetical protein
VTALNLSISSNIFKAPHHTIITNPPTISPSSIPYVDKSDWKVSLFF